MSATIHYLRPFQREDLTAYSRESPQGDESPDGDREVEPRQIARSTSKKSSRAMPCGRNSRFKKRMDGKVVPREDR
jgi:hypothetical protein